MSIHVSLPCISILSVFCLYVSQFNCQNTSKQRTVPIGQNDDWEGSTLDLPFTTTMAPQSPNSISNSDKKEGVKTTTEKPKKKEKKNSTTKKFLIGM